MPQYKQTFDPEKGPHLEITLSKPLSIFEEDDVKSSMQNHSFLIDTGASKTVVSKKIALELGLPVTGKDTVKTANGSVKCNIRQGDLTCDIFKLPGSAIYLPDLRILELDLEDGWRGGFIGRDFLQKIILEINSPDKYFKITI
ncbi:MAG: retropepsin-like aspartic protease [Alphaproteobacteria bacterium]